MIAGVAKGGCLPPSWACGPIHPPRIFFAKMNGGSAGLCGAGRSVQPVQDIGDFRRLAARGQGGAVDHDDRQVQGARRDEFGLCARTARVLADDPGDTVVLQQGGFRVAREGAAIDNDVMIGQRRGRVGRVHQPQEIVVLRSGGKGGEMHSSDGKQDTLGRAVQRGNCASDIGDMGPVIARPGRPGRAGEGDERRAGDCCGLQRIAADLFGKGVGCVDQMRDGVVLQVLRQPLWPAKAAAAHGHRLRAGPRDTPGIAERCAHPLLRQHPDQFCRPLRAAKDEDVVHG